MREDTFYERRQDMAGWKSFIWLGPVCLFVLLVIAGARMHPLWGDEAEVAVSARSILRYGIPRGWDGINILGYDGTLTLTRDLIVNGASWLPLYLTAGSFLLLGESALAARLPFMVASVLSLLVLHDIVRTLTRSRRVAFLTILLLSTSIPYVLYAYQARYYALTVLGGLCLLRAVLSLASPSRVPIILFFLGGIIFIYSQQIIYPIFVFALLVAALREKLLRTSSLRTCILVQAAVVALFLPWFIRFAPQWPQGGITMTRIPYVVSTFLPSMGLLLSALNRANILPYGMGVFIVWYALRGKHTGARFRAFRFLLTILIVYICTVGVVSPVLYHNRTYGFLPEIRFHVVLFPIETIIVALVVDYLWDRKKVFGAGVAAVLVTSNALTFMPPRVFMAEYLGEVRRPYTLPNEAVAAYLSAHTKKNDTVFLDLERNHEELLFALDQRVRFVNRIQPTDTRVLLPNKQLLPKYVYLFLDRPDWIVRYSLHAGDRPDFRWALPKGIIPIPDLDTAYDLTVLPVYWQDTSRPEIDQHRFAATTPAYEDQIFIYHKKEASREN